MHYAVGTLLFNEGSWGQAYEAFSNAIMFNNKVTPSPNPSSNRNRNLNLSPTTIPTLILTPNPTPTPGGPLLPLPSPRALLPLRVRPGLPRLPLRPQTRPRQSRGTTRPLTIQQLRRRVQGILTPDSSQLLPQPHLKPQPHPNLNFEPNPEPPPPVICVTSSITPLQDSTQATLEARHKLVPSQQPGKDEAFSWAVS